jgi:hypothetical protein
MWRGNGLCRKWPVLWHRAVAEMGDESGRGGAEGMESVSSRSHMEDDAQPGQSTTKSDGSQARRGMR